MTIKELFAVCENLSHMTYFEIIRNDKVIDAGYYTYLHAKWCNEPIAGFRLSETGLCQIYLGY